MKHLPLDVYRVLYCVYVLFVGPRLINPAIGDLPQELFNMPWGFHLLFSGPPGASTLVWLEFVRWACLTLLLFNVAPRAASLTALASWVLLLGFESSLGKIDHDLIMAAPLLAFGLSGWSDGTSRGVYLVAALLSCFFLTSGLIKLFSGWLNFRASAVAGIMSFCVAVYGSNLSAWHDTPFAVFKTLDVATVLLECSFAVILFYPRLLPLWALAAWGFHEGVHLTLGINFKKLSILYLLFVPPGGALWQRALAHLRAAAPGTAWRGLFAAAVVGAALNNTLAEPASSSFRWFAHGVRPVWEKVFPCWLLFYVAREGWRLLQRRRAVSAGP